MRGTMPSDVKHYCRKCGTSFVTGRGGGTRPSAHTLLVSHVRSEHGFRAADQCHSNCSFKATYEEAQTGRMLYGQGAH